MAYTPIILIHIVSALGAVAFGAAALAMRKGSRAHRVAGRVWVLLMLTTALVSFGIRSHGQFSAIHILSVVALAGIASSLFAVTRGHIAAHRRGMLATYASLLIAGIFALLPGRRLGDLVWQTIGAA